MYARLLACIGLGFVTFCSLLAILWGFWWVVFGAILTAMPDTPDWLGDLELGVAVLSGLVLYFLVVTWEVSRVMNCRASQAKGLVAVSGTVPLLTFAVAVWYVFKDWSVLGSY
jgi:hypothetical protein